MNAANTASFYKNQQVMTAPPEELTLMLYNGAISFVNESMKALEQNNIQQAHNANLKAQNIVREFIATLDMQYEISQSLFRMYDYIEYRLIHANMDKDKCQLEEAKQLLLELRDSWYQAMKLARSQRAVGK